MAATANGKCVVVIKGEGRTLQFVGNQSTPYALSSLKPTIDVWPPAHE